MNLELVVLVDADKIIYISSSLPQFRLSYIEYSSCKFRNRMPIKMNRFHVTDRVSSFGSFIHWWGAVTGFLEVQNEVIR